MTRWFEFTRICAREAREQALKGNPTFAGIWAAALVLAAIPLDLATMPLTLVGLVIMRRVRGGR